MGQRTIKVELIQRGYIVEIKGYVCKVTDVGGWRSKNNHCIRLLTGIRMDGEGWLYQECGPAIIVCHIMGRTYPRSPSVDGIDYLAEWFQLIDDCWNRSNG